MITAGGYEMLADIIEVCGLIFAIGTTVAILIIFLSWLCTKADDYFRNK